MRDLPCETLQVDSIWTFVGAKKNVTPDEAAEHAPVHGMTKAFSKRVENLRAAVSLHFAYYNYCRGHQSLGGKTAAMAAGLADHVWTVDELIGLLSAAEATPIKRGSYRKTRELKAVERGEKISD